MQAIVELMLFEQAGVVYRAGERYVIPAHTLVVTDEQAAVAPCSAGAARAVGYCAGDFKGMCGGAFELDAGLPLAFRREAVRLVALCEPVAQVMARLAEAHRSAYLQFAFLYCLGIDRCYFTGLLRHCLAGNRDLFTYLENNYWQPWSVSRYAAELGIPARKLNYLFKDQYGVSAKQWLLDRRLRRARELLISSAMRVIDIALECGFGNHAHFTESFKKKYDCSPTEIRQLEKSLQHPGDDWRGRVRTETVNLHMA